MLLVVAVATPVALAALVALPATRAGALAVAAWAAGPAVALALASSHRAIALDLPWLVLGTRLAAGPGTFPLLLAAASLWLAAGVFASGYVARDAAAPRFHVCFLLAMAGNLGFIVGADVVTAYLAYTTMSLATYGLVAHPGTPDALRAARLYIALAIVSEALLLAGATLAVAAAGGATGFDAVTAAIATTRSRDVVLGLLVAGFGVKAALIGLHVWLPPAHSIAPTPASAVLSGAMVKVGVLGWLRVIPPEVATSAWPSLLIGLGFAGVVYGVAIGLTQRRPKPILAYSSVSQLGLLAAAVGLAVRGGAADAVGVYALHHGLVKGALFLGAGLAQARASRAGAIALRVGLVASALTLAAAPLTGGAVAKLGVKASAAGAPGLALALSSAGTALLMTCFLRAVWTPPAADARAATRREWAAWLALSAAGLVLPWVVSAAWLRAEVTSWGSAASSAWPVVAGAAAGTVVLAGARRLPRVAIGDLAAPLMRATERVTRAATAGARRWPRWRAPAGVERAPAHVGAVGARVERGLERWVAVVVAFLAVVAVVVALLAAPYLALRLPGR